jgi:beta-glucosidase
MGSMRQDIFAISGGPSSKNRDVLYAPGCLDSLQCDKTDLAPVVAAVQNANAVVVVLGLDQEMESEGHDRTSIQLPSGQYKLFTAVRNAAGKKPVITVLVHGGTMALSNIWSDSDAVLDAWYPGQQGGNAVSDVLFGFYNPAGRASATYYSSDSDLPPNLAQQDLYPNQTSGYKGLTYRYFTGAPVIPFGHGLSYTTFLYSNLSLSTLSPGPCDTVTVRVWVKNTGTARSGDEVVQVYVSQKNATAPVPRIRLAAFQRVRNVAPQQLVQVQLDITPEYHSTVIEASSGSAYDAHRVVEQGVVSVYVGGGQPSFATTVQAAFTVAKSFPLDLC